MYCQNPACRLANSQVSQARTSRRNITWEEPEDWPEDYICEECNSELYDSPFYSDPDDYALEDAYYEYET